jgi:hypothetical protein
MVIVPVAKGFRRGFAPIDKNGKSKSIKMVLRKSFFIAISRFFLQKYNNYRFPPNFVLRKHGIAGIGADTIRRKGTGRRKKERGTQ